MDIKKSWIMILLSILLVLAVLPVYGTSNYADINDSHWAYPYIEELSKDRIIEGYEDGRFRPEKQVTYAEFIKLVYAAVTGELLDQSQGTHWGLNYYIKSMNIGLFEGNDIKTDQLDEVIPRKHMALITANSLSIKTEDTSEIIHEINDVDEETEYWYEIAVSYKAGILNGYPDGSFRPEDGLSRAEAAKIIYCLMSGSNSDSISTVYLGKQEVANRDYDVETYETELGYKGIEAFVYASASECIGVYSDRIQDLSFFVDGHKAMPVVNKEGEFWKDGDNYIYVFDVKGMIKETSKIGLAFGAYVEEVFYFKDALL